MPPTTQSVATPPHTIPVPAEAQPYLCSIPRPSQPALNDAEIEAARIASLAEAERANRRGWELLEGMKGKCIFHVKGWWAYEYCYGTPDSKVKQFHPVVQESGKVRWPLVVDNEQAYFILGRAQPTSEAKPNTKTGDKEEDGKKGEGKQKTLGDETKRDDTAQGGEVKPGDVEVAGKTTSSSKTSPIPPGGTLVNKGETTYLTHHLTSGTKCDLTYRQREVEIQYHCRPELTVDYIAVVKEITTCSYLMVVQTPRLCKDPAFQKKPVTESLEITCRRISEHAGEDFTDEGIAASEQEVAKVFEKQRKSTGPKMPYKDGKPVIGGTVIGGGKYFPIKEGEEPPLKQPANWRPSGTKANPDGELVHDETEKPSAKFRLGQPTIGGDHVGPASPRIIEMASVKRDHADVVYTVVASGIIGDPNWEVLDEQILKAFKLGPDEIGLILQDVDWKTDGKGMDGQRWYLVVLTGPKVQKGLEIRAVVENEVEVKETVTKKVAQVTGAKKQIPGHAESTLKEKEPKEDKKAEQNEVNERRDQGLDEEAEAEEETKQPEPKSEPQLEPDQEQQNIDDETGDESAEEESLGGSEEEMVEKARDEL